MFISLLSCEEGEVEMKVEGEVEVEMEIGRASCRERV